MSQNTNTFSNCFYFKMTTPFGLCSGPSSGHKSIYSRKLYTISHKIYQSKIQRHLIVVQYSNAVSFVLTHLENSPYCVTKHNGNDASKDIKDK